jgi:hypothetical protein
MKEKVPCEDDDDAEAETRAQDEKSAKKNVGPLLMLQEENVNVL